jgi:hypothetical protein
VVVDDWRGNVPGVQSVASLQIMQRRTVHLDQATCSASECG